MQTKAILLALILCGFNNLLAQPKVKDFFYLEPDTKELPVFVRGNLKPKKVLLYVQGGGADNGIDFGRSDYPKWKETLEKEVAIAYFDQRGLNKTAKNIDTSKINKSQISKDIISIAQSLMSRYDAEIYLFGHSYGGVKILECLANFPKEAAFIKSGIAFNAPITTDFSPERYNYYRPLYLKNLAKEFIEKEEEPKFWQEALGWMEQKDSIYTIEDSKKWNEYVDGAIDLKKRNIGLGMILATIFAKPYNPISYLNNKDNKRVADKLWYAEKELWDTGTQTTLWELLPEIEHPILLITGRFDAIATPEEQEEANKLLQQSRLVILPNAGHESYLFQPELFYREVISFLE